MVRTPYRGEMVYEEITKNLGAQPQRILEVKLPVILGWQVKLAGGAERIIEWRGNHWGVVKGELA